MSVRYSLFRALNADRFILNLWCKILVINDLAKWGISDTHILDEKGSQTFSFLTITSTRVFPVIQSFVIFET